MYTPDKVKGYIDTHDSRYQILERFYKTKVPYYLLRENQSGEEFIVDEADRRAQL